MITYDRELFKKLWNQGLLMRELAQRFNCTKNTVYNIAKREKIGPYSEVLNDA